MLGHDHTNPKCALSWVLSTCMYQEATTHTNTFFRISLVFSKVIGTQVHFHNGRISKIVSIMASYCSVRFAHHISRLTNSDIYDQIFDARVVIINESYELANYFIWRSIRDCERNAVSAYAHVHFSNKELKYKWKDQMINMLERKDKSM